MPRRYVVEASVAVRWFLPDQDLGSHAARFLALLLAGDIEVLAPGNLIHEFCGVICDQFRSRRKSADDATEVVREFLKLPISYVESNDLIERAAQLSMIHRKTFYDMYYFSVGESLGVPVCTADEKSVGGVGNQFPQYVLLKDLC